MSLRHIALATAAAWLTAGAAQAASVTAIQSWNGSTGYAWGRPFVAPSGVIYGVLSTANDDAAGSVYALTPPKAPATTWSLATISTFSPGTYATGTTPTGGLITDPGADASGDLYGAAATGGNSNVSGSCVYTFTGCGVIYRLSPPAFGTTWTRTVIHSFNGTTDGAYPLGDLVADSTGALYGVTQGGGCTPSVLYPEGCGTVFRLTPPAKGTLWTETVLYRFRAGTRNGLYPSGGLVMDSAGNLYGATWFGGTPNCGSFPSVSSYAANPSSGCGTLFEMVKGSTGYTHKFLHFFSDGTDGSYPASNLAIDNASGLLYGTTAQGGDTAYACTQYGQSGCGVAYALRISSKAKHTYATFSGANGGFPTPLIRDGAGHLFGEAAYNSADDSSCATLYCGTAFELAIVSHAWTVNVLQSFTGATGLGGPEYGMAADSAGTLYGVAVSGTTSTLFSITGSGFKP